MRNTSCGKRKPRLKQSLPADQRDIWHRKDLRARYDISAPTLWRWEKTGRIPPRDVLIGGVPDAWKKQTILMAENGIV